MGQLDNAQTSQGPLSCVPEFPQLPAGQEHTMDVVATFQADEITNENQRLPIRLSAVLDKSGSMAGSKLDLVKGTTKFLVQHVIDKDCVGIVTYDSMVTEDAKVQPVTPEYKRQLDGLIGQIYAGSCTNLSGGLFKGLQQLQEWKEPDVHHDVDKKPVYAAFLFTDGMANEGITNADVLANAVKTNLAGFGPAVKIHTFGFGEDHDPTFLRKISEASGGDYYFVRTQEEIPTAFADALGGMLSVSAQNVEMTISAGSDDVTIVNVNTSFKTEKLADGSHKVIFGDLFSEERKDVLLTIRLKPLTPTSDTTETIPNATINLSAHFLDVNTGTFCTRKMQLVVPRPAAAPLVAPTPHPEVVSQRNRVQTAAAMQAAMEAADSGNMEEARRALARQAVVLAECEDEGAQAMLADVQCQQQMYQSRETYKGAGGKAATATWQAYSRQRKATGAMASAPVAKARNAIQERLVSSSSLLVGNQANQAPQQLVPQQQQSLATFSNIGPVPNVDPQQQQSQASSSSLLSWLTSKKQSARK